MTRETKIGMAIATTFLSLVGLVVASKLRPPEVVEVRPDRAKPGAEESSAPPTAPQPSSNGVRTAQGTEPAPAAARESPAAVPAKKKETAPKQPNQPKQIVTADGLPVVPATPEPLKLAPAGGPPALDVKPPFPGLPEASPNTPGGLPAIESNPLVIEPSPKNEPKRLGAMPPTPAALGASAPMKVEGVKEPGSAALPQPLPIPFKDPLAKDPLAKDPLAKDPLAGKPNGLPGVPPVKEPIVNSIQLPPVQPDPLKQKPEPMPIVPPRTPDPIKPKLDVNVGNPSLPEKKTADLAPPPLTPGGVTAPIAPAPKGVSIGTIGNAGGEIRITSPVTPGGAGQIPGANVPLLPAATSNLPKVTSYEDKSHIVQPTDTSFDELSKTLYGTPAYGPALREYNRQHVLATSNLKQNPPMLQPNQRVYYPDVNVLEKQYKPLIQGLPTTASTVKISAPTPLLGPGSVSGANPPTADATANYRLAQPLFIYDIARQQLGDGLLWPEILRLNPALRTDQPIPAGTELRLPKAR
jgi:hypothetical protein